MRNEIIEDATGRRWKVREAVSLAAAEEAIAYAKVSGSVGSKHLCNGEVTADVVEINSDGSECQPYTQAY